MFAEEEAAPAAFSSQTVGFTTEAWMPADFVMMGGQFENTDGSAVKLSQINFGKDFTGPEYGDGPDAEGSFIKTAPQVQLAFRDSEGTVAYYFLCDGKVVDEEQGIFAPGWVDADGNEADPDVELALGFWFKDAFNKARFLQNKGQVMEENTFEKDFNIEFRMLVSPYPKATKLSEITFVDIEQDATEYGDGESFVKTATQIQIPFADSEGFTSYYFLADGKVVDEEQGIFAPGWVDADGNEVDPDELVIPPTRGCWFRPCKDFKADKMTVVFTK